MRIAVLALQGAFIEHERMLQQLGAECFEVRQLSDWNQPKDGLVIPGGESTTMLKLLHDLELLQPIRGHCRRTARLRHLCRTDPAGQGGGGRGVPAPLHDGYPRAPQRLWTTVGQFPHLPRHGGGGHRSPCHVHPCALYRKRGGRRARLASVDGHIVAARQGNQLVTAFHPELDSDLHIHKYFLSMIAA